MTSLQAGLERNSVTSGESFVTPDGSLEGQLARIWAAALSIDKVDRDDDFFDLGGDSMAAVEICGAISRELGLELPTHVLLRAPTVAALSRAIEEARQQTSGVARDENDTLIALRTSGHLEPVCLVPARSGRTIRYRALVDRIAPDRPVYAVVHPPLASIPALARHHLTQIRRIAKSGSFDLVGQCWGSLVVLEMARLAPEYGLSPRVVAVFDPPLYLSGLDRSMAWFRQRVLPFLTYVPRRLHANAKDLRSTSRAERRAWLAEKARTMGRRLRGQGSNRDFVEKLLGGRSHRVLTDASLRHQPLKPTKPVHVILSTTEGGSGIPRGMRRIVEFLGASERVHLVHGDGTADVLLHNVSELASVVGRLLEQTPTTGTADAARP